jgi:hypothetical protein
MSDDRSSSRPSAVDKHMDPDLLDVAALADGLVGVAVAVLALSKLPGSET